MEGLSGLYCLDIRFQRQLHVVGVSIRGVLTVGFRGLRAQCFRVLHQRRKPFISDVTPLHFAAVRIQKDDRGNALHLVTAEHIAAGVEGQWKRHMLLVAITAQTVGIRPVTPKRSPGHRALEWVDS